MEATLRAPTSLPDAELVDRVRAHDPDAFAELVDQHKDTMVGYLTRLVGCRDRAEDLAQETFVRFYERLGRYRHEGHLAAYLFRIATNLVRSEERRRKRFRLLLPFLSAPGHSSMSKQPTKPSVDLIANEEQRQVTDALEALDLRFRAPLVLREIEGFSYGEIATALELSEGTVKSRLHRGRELLKKKLAPYWNGGRACA